MKKILILLAALILVAGFAYAQEYFDEFEEEETNERAIEFFDWEFSISYPVHWSGGVHDDAFWEFNPDVVPDKTVTANIAIGTSISFNFTQYIGLILDADFFYSTKLTGFGYSSSDSNTMVGTNVFLGPQFYIVNSDRLRIPLAVGFHMYYFSDEVWMPHLLHDGVHGNDPDSLWMNRSDLQFGPGVMFGIQFHFDNSIYLFSRTSVYLDFIRMHKYEGILYAAGNVYEEYTHTDVIESLYWTIKPTLGIGVKF